VGAYAARSDWLSLDGPAGSFGIFLGYSEPGALAYFTGLGPNRKGVLKPEITAPGRWVMASLSRWAWPVGEILSIFESPVSGKPLALVATDSIHSVSQGTSFATPHVAGVCALLLQADPLLDNSQIKSILTSTAATDSMISGAPDNYWGHGRANAISAARRALGLENDTLCISAALDPPDTLWTDSLAYTVSIDFSGSSQKLVSFSMNVHWPPKSLGILFPVGGTAAEDTLNLEFDTTAIGNGLLGVTGFAGQELPAGNNLVKLAFTPVSAAFLDSVAVTFELESLKGDLAPFELSETVEISQAGQVALRPVLACKVPGDVDRSGKLDIFDLIQIVRILSGRQAEHVCSDIDRNGDTNIFDLLKLLRLLAGR
jgi:subtilisin family serine protease